MGNHSLGILFGLINPATTISIKKAKSSVMTIMIINIESISFKTNKSKEED